MHRLLMFLRPAVAWLFLVAGLRAHNMPGSAVALDFETDRVVAGLTLPLIELEPAFGHPFLAAPAATLALREADLRAYLVEHIHPVAPDGRPWSVEPGALRLQLATEPCDLLATVVLRPPAGASPRRFDLHYDVIGHEVNNHYTLLTVRRDWDTAVLETPEPVGIFQYTVKTLTIDRSGGSWRTGFRAMLRLGVRHIAEGTDHLLFLLVLLLPAPLLAAGPRWGAYGGLRRALRELLKIVTAFTAGHSLTLLAGTLGWFRLPAQPVELLIAGSILVSAVHAVRPCFAGRELFVAAGFGLVHGLAFADTLAGLGLSSGHLALALLAFNLGIELMQLAVVAVAMPSLLLLARTRFYPALRLTAAGFGGVAALGWIVERASGRPNFVGDWLVAATRHATPAAIALLGVALVAAWNQRRRLEKPARPV